MMRTLPRIQNRGKLSGKFARFCQMGERFVQSLNYAAAENITDYYLES